MNTVPLSAFLYSSDLTTESVKLCIVIVPFGMYCQQLALITYILFSRDFDSNVYFSAAAIAATLKLA